MTERHHLSPAGQQSSDLLPAPGYAAGHWTAHRRMAPSRSTHRRPLRWQSAGYLHDVIHWSLWQQSTATAANCLHVLGKNSTKRHEALHFTYTCIMLTNLAALNMSRFKCSYLNTYQRSLQHTCWHCRLPWPTDDCRLRLVCHRIKNLLSAVTVLCFLKKSFYFFISTNT